MFACAGRGRGCVAGGSLQVRVPRSPARRLEPRRADGRRSSSNASTALPDVHLGHHDRAFPHTLRVHVVPEQPVAVLRRGEESWLVSARGRVMRRSRWARRDLPGSGCRRGLEISKGAFSRTSTGALAARSARRVRRAAASRSVAFVARSTDRSPSDCAAGSRSNSVRPDRPAPEDRHRAGHPADPRVARPGGPDYLDVTVPERPVAGATLNPQVELDGCLVDTPVSGAYPARRRRSAAPTL